MIEWAELLGSILSNRTELHSFELGVLLALLTVLIISFASRQTGGGFLSVIVIAVFFINPIQVIQAKPWYFLSGVVGVLSVFEAYYKLRYGGTMTELLSDTFVKNRLIACFTRR